MAYDVTMRVHPETQKAAEAAAREGIAVTLGNMHVQDDGSAQLPFFMTCSGLCGIGKTSVLK